MKKPTRFQPYDREQMLLAPDMRQWLPEGDRAYFLICLTDNRLKLFRSRWTPAGA
jgi:hypothetical protein